MTNRLWPADAINGTPAYSGRALRQTQSPFVAGATASRPLGARSGVRPGTSAGTVGASATQWYCGPHAGVLDVMTAAEAGPYTYAIDAGMTGSIDASNASNPRTDIVYVQLSDPAEGGTPGQPPSVTVAYKAGVAGPSAVTPTPPSRSMVLARINVPKTGGGNPTVTWVAPYAVSAGGTLPVDTLANLRGVVGTSGQQAVVYDDPSPLLNGNYRWAGTTWVPTALPQNLMRWLPGSYARVAGASPIMQMGQAQGTTSSTGRLDHVFQTPFPNGISGVILMPHQNSGYAAGAPPVLVEDSLTVNGFSTFWGGRATSGVYIPYLAIGF